MLSTCLYASAGSPENKQKKLEILTDENMYLREMMKFLLEEQKQTTSDAKYFFYLTRLKKVRRVERGTIRTLCQRHCFSLKNY